MRHISFASCKHFSVPRGFIYSLLRVLVALLCTAACAQQSHTVTATLIWDHADSSVKVQDAETLNRTLTEGFQKGTHEIVLHVNAVTRFKDGSEDKGVWDEASKPVGEKFQYEGLRLTSLGWTQNALVADFARVTTELRGKVVRADDRFQVEPEVSRHTLKPSEPTSLGFMALVYAESIHSTLVTRPPAELPPEFEWPDNGECPVITVFSDGNVKTGAWGKNTLDLNIIDNIPGLVPLKCLFDESGTYKYTAASVNINRSHGYYERGDVRILSEIITLPIQSANEQGSTDNNSRGPTGIDIVYTYNADDYANSIFAINYPQPMFDNILSRTEERLEAILDQSVAATIPITITFSDTNPAPSVAEMESPSVSFDVAELRAALADVAFFTGETVDEELLLSIRISQSSNPGTLLPGSVPYIPSTIEAGLAGEPPGTVFYANAVNVSQNLRPPNNLPSSTSCGR